MLVKPRFEPKKLELLRCLNARMNLPTKEANDLLSLEKGYEGEKKFDDWLENHSDDGLVLNDLLLESNNTLFQIDSLMITQKKIYLFEVKNYEGDFYVDDDRWHALSGIEIKSPLLQLKRSESLFRRLLQDWEVKMPLEAYLIFMNPQFHLYQAPLNLAAVFPPQLNRFMERLKKEQSKLKENHLSLAKQLLAAHLEDSPYTRFPHYHFSQLKKGILCSTCQSISIDLCERTLVCNECGHKENINTGVLRSVNEFHTLFPDRKITTTAIQEWCEILSKKVIHRVLSKHFKLLGHGKSAHYIQFEKDDENNPSCQ
ncbi:MAG TPA: nuclease-related domain-containing protein [Bacillales bacterium]|nr:nuclease-related domain-containing protein [Bacillales bacterium]